MAAILSRQQTGKGVWIDCNLFECQVGAIVDSIGADSQDYMTDSRSGEHSLELSCCWFRSIKTWNRASLYRALSGLSLQRWFLDDRGWQQ
jgi:crotonobetainyl-CoA:carnitine CoA-transferase CaiB-like acyl-CoA transferase